MSIMKKLADGLLIAPARRIPALRHLLHYVAGQVPGAITPYKDEVYQRLRQRFIDNGAGGKYDPATRRGIVERFELVDRNVNIGHSPTDLLHIAEAALSLQASGDLVECGCFNGGSTAKLSILAQITGRRLFVFDSFEGLPEVDDYNKHDLHMRHDRQWMNPWRKGDWGGGLELVQNNIRQWGEIAACTFIKGWFNQTMTDANLPAKIALAFVDVDIPSSVQQCLEALWPRLDRGGVFFSHDIGFIKVLQVLNDPRLWSEKFHEPQPIIFGAGYGMGDTSRMVGFMIRGHDLTADTIKNLTIER